MSLVTNSVNQISTKTSLGSLSWKGFKYVARAPKVIYDYIQVIFAMISVGMLCYIACVCAMML